MMQKNNSKPKREPLSRLWFMSRGYSKADPQYTNGYAIWLHPQTNDVLNQYGQKIKLNLLPKEKFKKNATRYLQIPREFGNRYLARLKYITFKGNIPDGHTIDHIDGNPLNNDIRNLRAVTRAINYRDGGFLRKLRHKGIQVDLFPGIILEGYERMAQWKASHTKYEYKRLDRVDLLRIFVGPTFNVADPNYLDDLSINRHYDQFVERN